MIKQTRLIYSGYLVANIPDAAWIRGRYLAEPFLEEYS